MQLHTQRKPWQSQKSFCTLSNLFSHFVKLWRSIWIVWERTPWLKHFQGFIYAQVDIANNLHDSSPWTGCGLWSTWFYKIYFEIISCISCVPHLSHLSHVQYSNTLQYLPIEVLPWSRAVSGLHHTDQKIICNMHHVLYLKKKYAPVWKKTGKIKRKKVIRHFTYPQDKTTCKYNTIHKPHCEWQFCNCSVPSQKNNWDAVSFIMRLSCKISTNSTQLYLYQLLIFVSSLNLVWWQSQSLANIIPFVANDQSSRFGQRFLRTVSSALTIRKSFFIYFCIFAILDIPQNFPQSPPPVLWHKRESRDANPCNEKW